MDTNISEPKQGAAATADLLQQQPHVEVIDIKSSVASSDEERLAAGISTIGLQTKRLSGAQRKRLTKETKMKEGTWTEKKPPTKTPLSQEKGAGRSSGGVKRSHSDSSTPSSETQQPKKPRSTQLQTGSYKEAVTHRRHPEVTLDQTQVDLIQVKLLLAVDENPLEEAPPQFLHSKFHRGYFGSPVQMNIQRSG
jgi:hypothetical protein